MQSLQERGCLRPTPQFGSLYGGGTAKGRDGAGTRQVHLGEAETTADATEAANAEDTLFGDLRRAVLKPQLREQHRNAWISEETWKLVDERVTMRRKARARMVMRRLGRAIQANLKGDRRH